MLNFRTVAMERVSRIIGNLDVPEAPLTPEQVVLAAWPRAVGKRLSGYTRAAKLVRSRLVIEVEDAVWQRNLFTLSRSIIANLVKHVGPGVVDDLEFRVVPRRREPQRALHSTPLLQDDADAIQDPTLRRLYKSSACPRGIIDNENMSLNEDDVRYVAALANLNLTTEEVPQLVRNLGEILAHMDRLGEISTAGVEPMAQVLYDAPESATLREDLPREPLGQVAALANAPLSAPGYFKVPLVIER